MPYLGKSPLTGNFQKLDDFSGDFDGSDATHALAQNGLAVTPVTEAALIISINGVIQEPVTDYTVSGTNITFTTAPASGAGFFGVVLGERLDIGTPSDSTVTSAKLSGNLVTPGTLDVNGQELILDADADTSITASTDDQIDIKISGADDFTFTANTFTAASGSGVVIPDGGLTLGSTVVSSTAAELNILDGVTSTAAELNILDGVTSTAAELNILDGVTSTATELNKLDALSRGSILYGNASAVTTVLTKGSANEVLTSDGTDLSWAAASGGLASGDIIGADDGAVGAPGLTFADDLDNGLYRIGTNNWAMAAAGAKVWSVSAAGEINTPLNPAFHAYYSGADLLNVTGDGTEEIANYNAEAYDYNSDYNTTTFTFTAPITGAYALHAVVYALGITSAHGRYRISIQASNRAWVVHDGDPYAVVYGGQAYGIGGGGDLDMDAADTALVEFQVDDDDKSVDTIGQMFSGHLIG